MKKQLKNAQGTQFGGSPNREVRIITPDLIEDYLTIYLSAYPAFKDVGDEGREKYRRRYTDSMLKDKNITFCGLFEDNKLIAIMKLIDFSMNAFGGMKPAVGLMALAVHPMHKKKGAALDMVRFFEQYTKDTGALVSMLLPFRMDFYRKMGYGYGSKLDEYRIPTLSLPKCEDPKELSKIRFCSQDELSAILEFQKTFASQNHGMLCKFEDEIRDMKADSASLRAGYFDSDRSGNPLRGYVIYSVMSESDVNYTLNRLEVKELAYDDGAVLLSLLGFLRNQSDLAQTTVIRTGEEDFYHVLPSAQDITGNYIDYGFLQTNVGAVGTMYKIVDPEFFVKSTDYREFLPMELTAAFDYYDELAHAEKSIVIQFIRDGETGVSRWKVADAQGADAAIPDIRIKCNLADFSSLMMGSCRLSSLLRLGSVTAACPKAANACDILDALLYCRQKPWTNTDY